MEEDVVRPPVTERLASVLERAERVYLRILRAVILVIATLLIAYAAWLLVSSVYKIAQSPETVEEKPAVVAADELTSAEMPDQDTASSDTGPKVNSSHRGYYNSFVNRYYALFKTKFEPFRQKEDKQLTRDQFDDSFVKTSGRLEAISRGEMDFEREKADLNALLAVMTEAAAKPQTKERLQKYRSAKKVRVAKKVQRSRTETRRGWNPYSMSCPGWYNDPIGCAENRQVEVPYTQTIYSQELPKGTQSHSQIFRAFQDRFFQLLQERRTANAQEAADERAGILAGVAEGKLSLFTVLQILGGFLVLMFFFLLIAIERHQRKMSANPAPAFLQ
jgi:hypothetical protein